MGNPTTCQTNSASGRVTAHAPSPLAIAGPGPEILPAITAFSAPGLRRFFTLPTMARPTFRPRARAHDRGLPGWRSCAGYAVRRSRDGSPADIMASAE